MMQLCLVLTSPLKANKKLKCTLPGTGMPEVEHTKAGAVSCLTHLNCWKAAGLELHKD